MRPKPANRYLRTLILQRERSLAQKAVYRFLEVAFRRRLNRHYAEVNELVRLRRFAVMSPADLDLNLYRQLQGGDYWAAYELIKALGESGYLVTDEDPDVVIHLFGAPMDLPPRAYKILWIYSHPEQVTAELLGRYDRIFCLSAPFVAKIKEMGFTAELAVGATSPWDGEEPDQMYDYDIVFVGNNRGDDRMNLRALSRLSHRVKVWGRGWEGVIPENMLGGPYIDYFRLGELYRNSYISLNCQWPGMNEEGFVALRVFEILNRGGFCLSEANTGLQAIFGDTVPQFDSWDELEELVEHFLQNPAERLGLMKRGREIARSYSWQDRALQLVSGLPKSYS